MSILFRCRCASAVLAAVLAAAARAEPIKVMHPQGSAHGFVNVTTLEGKCIGVGDLMQRADGYVISSRLTLHFFDGSLDDETTVFSQKGVFRFLSDHHVQRGPSFPKPIDATIDAEKGLISITNAAGQVEQRHLEIPPDAYNGLASTLLMNIPAATSEVKIAAVVAAAKPRIVHLAMKNAGEETITIGGVPRSAIHYVVHVELGGVAGVVAPLVGKQPKDFQVLILGGEDPAFIREEGQLYEEGPVWRIQQISAEFPADR